MRRATRAAEVPNPGKFFGNDVTSFSSFRPRPIAGAAAGAAAMATPAAGPVARNWRRLIERLPWCDYFSGFENFPAPVAGSEAKGRHSSLSPG